MNKQIGNSVLVTHLSAMPALVLICCKNKQLDWYAVQKFLYLRAPACVYVSGSVCQYFAKLQNQIGISRGPLVLEAVNRSVKSHALLIYADCHHSHEVGWGLSL